MIPKDIYTVFYNNRPNMKSEKNEIYIFCPKKGKQRKHIDVCRQCRYRKKCKAYHGYMQPELPFIFSSEDLKMKEMEYR
jgi:hypothetical protein